MNGWTCDTCATTGRCGYCAPLRCYCGHGNGYTKRAA